MPTRDDNKTTVLYELATMTEDGWMPDVQISSAAGPFMTWVEEHSAQGIMALWLSLACSIVLMIPVGTPLIMACGYFCKAAYGWRMGLTIATMVAMSGAGVGSVVCFLLGRYFMRDQVRTWIRRYPIFDAIDIAAAEHGLRIMAMLYLTPILPLGPVSYMCGTTSIALSSFVLGKITSLPLTLCYCSLGASTGALTGSDSDGADQVQALQNNPVLVIGGVLMSLLMLTCITQSIKKELNRIVEREKKNRPDDETAQLLVDMASEDAGVEKCLGLTKRRISHSPTSLSHLVASTTDC